MDGRCYPAEEQFEGCFVTVGWFSQGKGEGVAAFLGKGMKKILMLELDKMGLAERCN